MSVRVDIRIVDHLGAAIEISRVGLGLYEYRWALETERWQSGGPVIHDPAQGVFVLLQKVLNHMEQHASASSSTVTYRN